jgi:hypothetical protein
MSANSLPDETHVPARLKRDKTFQPCLVESGDEHYANGIFEFNITRLLAYIDTCAERFPIECVLVDDYEISGRGEAICAVPATVRVCVKSAKAR